MPDFELNVLIKNVSKSDMVYVIDQLAKAIKISGGNLEVKKFLEFIKLEKREKEDEQS